MAAGHPSGGVYSLQGRFFGQAACGGEEERSLGGTPKPPPGAAPLDPAKVRKEDTTRWHVIPAPSASYAGERG